jgi:catechol 2,3-dioxygenase-like lactoylglutathione lyase family enzyme
MTISLSTVHVTVDDPDAALAFYRDTLGLTLYNEVENDGYRFIVLATERQPDIQIVLSHPNAGRSREDGDAVAALLAKGELGSLNFASDDLDATFATLESAPGVEVVQEPTQQPWGRRDAAVRDPAGNLIRIEQRG